MQPAHEHDRIGGLRKNPGNGSKGDHQHGGQRQRAVQQGADGPQPKSGAAQAGEHIKTRQTESATQEDSDQNFDRGAPKLFAAGEAARKEAVDSHEDDNVCDKIGNHFSPLAGFQGFADSVGVLKKRFKGREDAPKTPWLERFFGGSGFLNGSNDGRNDGWCIHDFDGLRVFG